MKTFGSRLFPVAALGTLLLAAGCLISGTFIIVQEFAFTTNNGHYFYPVDLTSESDWADHKDQIDLIDAVGLEFTIVNPGAATTFNVWVSPPGPESTSTPPAGATQIITDLPVPNGTTSYNYAQSLTFLTNITTLKSLVKGGKFNYYGRSAAGGTSFTINDGAKVIVTFSASGS